MAAVSTGSILFASAALVIISTSVLLVLRHYLPLRSTPAYLLLPVFLALALPSSIIVLVPIDLASAENTLQDDQNAGVWLPAQALLVTWRIAYWLTFVLTWVILPFLGEYCDSGDRDTIARIKYSLRSNLRYQLITISLAGVGFAYFVWENGFHFSSLRGLVMALAYAWGLFLAIGLMGHGLVTLPRRLIRSASVSGRLRQLESRAPAVKEKLDEARDELVGLEAIVVQLKQRKTGVNGNMRDWIEDLAETCTLSDLRPGNIPPVMDTTVAPPTVLTERYLADLTRKLKRSRHREARFTDEWTNLCSKAQDTQAILDAVSTQNLQFAGFERQTQSRSLSLLNGKTRFFIYYHVLPYGSIALGSFLALASISIVWSEIIAGFTPRLSLIGITTLPSIDGQFRLINQLIAAAWLLYMCTTALYALSDVKVWGNRALVKRHTYGESACWYALQVAKLTVPLSYNFITMMPAKQLYQATAFYKLLGQYVDLTPLGHGFSLFFPCFIVISSLASLFNLYGKAQNILGFGIIQDDDDDGKFRFGVGSWREGRALIERELRTNASRGVVGLDERGDSLDIERRAADASRHDRRVPPPRRPIHPITNEREEDLDESARHFYQDVGERLRNTIDTAEAPKWMRNIGASFKKPKWMQNDEPNGEGGDGGGTSAFSRFFGRGADDGRVRL